MVTSIVRRLAVVFAYLAFSRAAYADQVAEAPAVERATDATVAIAVNAPTSWIDGKSFGVSGYARLTDHQALRLNFATHAYGPNPTVEVLAGFLLDAEFEGVHEGRINDLGAGWQYYPRRTFDGPMLELGVLHRWGDVKEIDDLSDNEVTERDTQLQAGRALAGWSWLISNSATISLAFGASYGYEHGTQTTQQTFDSMPMTRDVGEWKTTAEGYIRFGVTFGK
jgi:hypothetical protein